jgi:hypothetical protein
MVRTCGKNVRRKIAKNMFKNTPEGKSSVEKPSNRWSDDTENY